MGSLRKFFRETLDSFQSNSAYITPYEDKKYKELHNQNTKLVGLSWKSLNTKVGFGKSLKIEELLPILEISNHSFLNLQYGDVNREIERIRTKNHFNILSLNLFDDIEDLAVLINLCSVIVTTSNSTAHLSGALGNTIYLLLSKAIGKFWYWHSSAQQSIWYSSIKIFKQGIDGDWLTPIFNLAKFIETSIEK